MSSHGLYTSVLRFTTNKNRSFFSFLFVFFLCFSLRVLFLTFSTYLIVPYSVALGLLYADVYLSFALDLPIWFSLIFFSFSTGLNSQRFIVGTWLFESVLSMLGAASQFFLFIHSFKFCLYIYFLYLFVKWSLRLIAKTKRERANEEKRRAKHRYYHYRYIEH